MWSCEASEPCLWFQYVCFAAEWAVSVIPLALLLILWLRWVIEGGSKILRRRGEKTKGNGSSEWLTAIKHPPRDVHSYFLHTLWLYPRLTATNLLQWIMSHLHLREGTVHLSVNVEVVDHYLVSDESSWRTSRDGNPPSVLIALSQINVEEG